jgi:uncharacterized repeat protein (TIGR01451 family)
MNKLRKLRHWFVSLIGILPLILSLANSKPVFADTSVSDISVRIFADRHTVRLGENVTFTVKVTNLGPDPAPFVDVYHNLPDQLSFVALTCDLGISPDTPACEYSLIEPGQTVVSTLVATPNPAALPHKRYLVTTATIQFETLDVVDPHLRNNSASVAVQLVGRFR